MFISRDTSLLFHGPEARREVLKAAQEWGRLIGVFGDERSLRTEHAREVNLVMSSVPVGDASGSVVIGPMDRARPEATDALLKSIEEYDPNVVRPYLWAFDAGSVSGTIRSRCFLKWCPGDGEPSPRVSLEEVVRSLVEAALDRDLDRVVDRMKSFKDMDKEDRISLPDVASRILLERLRSDDRTRESLRLWRQVRQISQGSPSYNESLRAFLLI